MDAPIQAQSRSSCSSFPTVYGDEFKISVQNKFNDAQITTPEYSRSATKHVLLVAEEAIIPFTELHARGILESMHEYAPMCGGDRGARYVSCAILSCDSEEHLVALASDWFKLLLWPFKKAYMGQRPPASSDPAPTFEQGGPASFEAELYRRQGGTCAVLRLVDDRYWKKENEIDTGLITAAHILRRSILTCDDPDDARKTDMWVSTLDILKNFADIPDETIKSFDTMVDDPRNGMLLEASMHDRFNHFAWCLVETDARGMFSVKWLTGRPYGIYKAYKRDTAVFTAHSPTPRTDASTPTPTPTSVVPPNPDPLFLRIHGAIAHILCATGAADYIDKIFDRFDPKGNAVLSNGAGFLDLRLSLIDAGCSSHQLPPEPRGWGTQSQRPRPLSPNI
ncbi:hypothetical protein BOTBODRAFT_191323 [Botryobasidium botryosum FD-172 SS1]|uniref:HNH nuclease domain-containing protein n=1 Tax=Botryobasidium botryosum (strain FD-172 SS1) TaxID=930990 RepID=A0A067M350_BOTB1|nr:hypothetical protein BOTBODRAFT_191323 [Botryobasidium botryosum FD-172 SS1]